MIGITARAAKLLKEKLAQIYIEAGGLDMIGISPEATEMMKEKLINSCFQAGIGFRIFVADNERGETTFSIKVDRMREGDKVLEVDGVWVFADPASAAQADDRELDYIRELEGSFVLR